MAYIALLCHEISHLYQIVNGEPLFDENDMKSSEIYTDYLTLYLGLGERVILGYMSLLPPIAKLNYLKYDELQFAVKRNEKLRANYKDCVI